MKPLQTLAIAGLVLGTTGPASAESYREQSQKSFDLAGITGFRAENPRGNTELRRSPDNQIHVTALKVARSQDLVSARKLAAEITVEIARESGTLVVRARFPNRMSVDIDFWDLMRGQTVPRSDLTLTVAIPDRFPVTVTAASGDVTSEHLSGSQSIRTASGDVSVTDATGWVELKTTSGDVTLSDVDRARIDTVSGDVEVESARNPLKVQTTNGDVTIHDSRDSLALQTVSGDIDVDQAPRGIVATTTNGNVSVGHASGPVRISTVNGDVHVVCIGPVGRTEVSTSTGDIELELSERLGCTLEARTASGEIDVQIPLEVKSVSRQLVSGVVRGGPTPVSLRTSSGDITLVGGGR